MSVAADSHPICVVVEEPGWLDDITVPGQVRPHSAGRWLILRTDSYRKVRLAGVEQVTRVLVTREAFGRSYLHAVSYCGKLIGVPGTRVLDTDAYSRSVVDGPTLGPGMAPPDMPVVVRKACGCGGAK